MVKFSFDPREPSYIFEGAYNKFNCYGKMEEDTTQVATTLGGIVSGAVGGPLSSPTLIHRYRAVLTSVAKINKQVDVNTRSILYNVGVRSTFDSLMPLRPKEVNGTDMSFVSSPVISQELSGAARRATQMASRWEKMDLAGVVERLASAIAVYRVTGELTQHKMAGGRELDIVAVDGVTRTIAASAGHVFVPSGAASSATPHMLAALCAAVTGAGSSMVTDLLGVDAATNRVRAPSASGVELAVGCYHALCLLGANYEAHGAGNIFSYACTVGIHKVMTVHAHTDEGGFTRDVFRKAHFGNSYGGIVSSVEPYTALPRPDISLDGFVKLVDNLALTTAGAVALCDPLTVVEGRAYPTVLDTFRAGGPKDGSKTDDDDARVHMRTIASMYTGFSKNYSTTLGKLYNTSGGDLQVVRHLNDTVNSMVGGAYSHLKYRVVAPFFWIEPTGSVHIDATDLDAQREGYGHLCTPYKDTKRPSFHNPEPIADCGITSGWRVEWVCARKHAMIHHLALHKLDGLANITPRQLDGQSMTLCGRGDASRPYMDVNERVDSNVTVDEYLWGRGHSSVIAPAEALYTGQKVGLLFKHVVVEEGGLMLTPAHFPRYDEVVQDIEFSVSRCNFVGEVRHDTPDKLVSRERRAANRALHAARLYQSGAPQIDALFPKLAADPVTGVRTPASDAEPRGLEITAGKHSDGVVKSIEILDQLDIRPLSNETTVGVKEVSATVRHGTSVGPRVASVITQTRGAKSAARDEMAENEKATRLSGQGQATTSGITQQLAPEPPDDVAEKPS